MAIPSKKSILLVEDEENLHEALKLNLELEHADGSRAGLAGREKIGLGHRLRVDRLSACSLYRRRVRRGDAREYRRASSRAAA